MIKVIHLQKHLPSSGNAAFRLHQAMRLSDIDSTMLSLTSDLQENDLIKHLGTKAYLISFINGKSESFLTKNSLKEFGVFSYPIFGTDISKNEQVKNADIIYLHWVIGGFLNLNSIERLVRLGKPIIFFMHDMWPITGGCHYSFTCEKYATKCNNCQMFPSRKKNDLSKKEFDKKIRLYSKYNNLYFVSPSKWLYDCAKKSFLTINKPVFYIPNILDNTLFKPIDKKLARQILNLNMEGTVISFGSLSLDSPYKGWTYLQKALELLPHDKNISVLIFGSGYSKKIADSISFKTMFMGRLRDEYSTVLAYNAADVFIAPSLADNLPTTIFESLSCGTPVVGFKVGGIPDMIKHKENGYLAKYRDAEDLAEGVKFCLEKKIKGYILPDLEQNIIINKHLELFKEVRLRK